MKYNFKNIGKKLGALAMAVVTLTACNDEFMDRLPQTDITLDNFLNTEQDLKMYTYNLYSFPSPWNYVGDAGTDNQATTSAVEVKNIMISTNPNSVTVSSGWDWSRLREINLFLENCDKANVSPEILAHYKGIARLFRANFYMDKVKRFSDVPWYDKSLKTSDTDLYKPRSPRDSVVQQIFSDYQFASANIKTGQLKGEVDKWVALTYMARNALYEGTFRKYHSELNLTSTASAYLGMARDAAREIMDNGKFSLYTTGKSTSDYASLFNNTNLSSNPEVIYAVYYDKKLISSGFWAYMFGNYEACPTKDLLQSYLTTNGTPYTSLQGYESNTFVKEFADRDPRLKQTFAYPGWELVNTSTYAPGAGTYIQSFNKNFTGYHQLKGFINDKSDEVYQSVDFPVLRYAEILLIYAEARAELGELTQKDLDESINLLRARAGMPPMQLQPVVDPVLQKMYPLAEQATSQWQSLLEIRRERRVELALEGFRYDDLMRWKAGKLLEKVPEGIYFPSLGKYDLTGDGIEDILLIPSTPAIPAESEKESNSLGKKLIYYKAGPITDSNATVYLKNGTSGNVITSAGMGTFKEPQYYYRPVPFNEVQLNKALLPQLFGWE